MKRWPDLKVVKPRTLEYQRAKSSNQWNVKRYFVEVSSILTKYNLFDKPHRVFNVDEKGITPNHAPPHVVSGTGDTPQAVTTGKSSTVTILGCGSASGVAIPPYFVFPGMRMTSELMEGSTPVAAVDVTESGWLYSVIFLQYLQSHFVHYVPGGLDEPVLLLLGLTFQLRLLNGQRNTISCCMFCQRTLVTFFSPWMLVAMASIENL